MCLYNCFFIFFTIRAASACISTILLTFATVGLLVVPFLPYSSNEVPFLLVMLYMALMFLAFCVSLCGAVTDSRKIVSTGFALVIVSFFFWALLTLSSLLEFSSDITNNFCLGNNCGETHWLVPRAYKQQEYKNPPSASAEKPRMGARMESRMNTGASTENSNLDEMLHEVEFSAQPSDEGIQNETLYRVFKNDPNEKETSSTITTPVSKMSEMSTLTPEDEEILDLAERIVNGEKGDLLGEKISRFLNGDSLIVKKLNKRENPEISRRQPSAESPPKHRLPEPRPKEFEIPPLLRLPKPRANKEFIRPKNSLLPLNKDTSRVLAGLYAVLYMFALGILCMNVISYFWNRCPETSNSCEEHRLESFSHCSASREPDACKDSCNSVC